MNVLNHVVTENGNDVTEFFLQASLGISSSQTSTVDNGTQSSVSSSGISLGNAGKHVGTQTAESNGRKKNPIEECLKKVCNVEYMTELFTLRC